MQIIYRNIGSAISMLAISMLVIFLNIAKAQEEQTSPIKQVREKFDNFEFGRVITLADSVLLSVENISKEDRSELLRMKGISQYSLSDTIGAGKSFEEILMVFPAYSLDSLNNSPKIIAFFNSVKSRFRPPEKQEMKTSPNIINTFPSVSLTEYNDRLKNSLVRSIIFPGWGHLYYGNLPKGLILSSTAFASLSSFIYFLSDSKAKEKSYLNERDPFLISDKYDKYNSSNKMKYISLSAYALIWLYSQADILFFSDDLFKSEIKPDVKSTQPDMISFGFSIPFK
ncbi:MAG: hypothetical protein Q8858_11085 [Bacteroidota bacterium]|nr:hypothetical protein [Bacteroidota bacterium]MDP4195227.1 hypothetical protein [Bacteroidota bacterium]